MAFNGSSMEGKVGPRIVLKPPKGEEVAALSYKLDFPCNNNDAKYKAFILKMLAAKELGIRRIQIKRDSNLIVQ